MSLACWSSVTYSTYIMTKDGNIWVWGWNINFELGLGTKQIARPKEAQKVYWPMFKEDPIKWMSCGLSHALIVTFGGKIYGIGNNEAKQLVQNNSDGNKKIPSISDWSINTKIIKISCGYRHTNLLDENGNVWGVGQNQSGALGVGKLGKIYPPVMLDSIKNVKIIDIASGDDHTLFLQSNGTVMTCGSNQSFQLGLENIEQSNTPIALTDFKNEIENYKVKLIHAGEKSSHVLLDNGEIYCWGSNVNGECATSNSYETISKPTKVIGLPRIVGMSGGYRHTIALASDFKKIFTWGYIYKPFTNLGEKQYDPLLIDWKIPHERRIRSIASARYHNLLLLDNGECFVWGQCNYGQLSPAGLLETHSGLPVPITFPGNERKQVVSLYFSGLLFWSVDTHHIFPFWFKKVVEVMMFLVRFRFRVKIPKPILYKILQETWVLWE